jgi:hypothetical protein
MLYKGVLKRVLPFFLTFAAGLFVASFFVSITSPSFSFPRRSHKFREMHRLRVENQELKRTNCELRKQLEEARRNSELRLTLDSDFPTFEPAPPPPPPAPRAPRFDR